MTKSVIALLLMTSIVTAAYIGSAYGDDKPGINWNSGKSAILFLPKHFESVPWLNTMSDPKVRSDFPVGSALENIGSFRLRAPGTQFSTNEMSNLSINPPHYSVSKNGG